MKQTPDSSDSSFGLGTKSLICTAVYYEGKFNNFRCDDYDTDPPAWTGKIAGCTSYPRFPRSFVFVTEEINMQSSLGFVILAENWWFLGKAHANKERFLNCRKNELSQKKYMHQN